MRKKTSRISDLDLVGRIYDAALDPYLWPEFLEGLSSKIGAQSGLLTFQDYLARTVNFIIGYGRDDQFLQSYGNHYVTKNPFLHLLAESRQSVYTTDDLIPDEKLVESEYYKEWLSPQDIHYQIGAIAFRDDSRLALVSCQRKKKDGPFDGKELKYLQILLPHLRRALNLNQKFWELLAQPSAATVVLDNLEMGVILINENKQPAYANRYAIQVTNQRRGLVIRPSGLSALRSEKAQALETLIREAVETGKGQGMSPGGAINLGIHQESPFYALVTPMRMENKDLGLSGTRICAAIFFSAPDMSRAVSTEVLRHMFDLTRAEANLVKELANGRKLDEIAQIFEISKHTARDQLKSVFSKTRTRRQTELTKLVLSSPSALIAENLLLGSALGGPLDRRHVTDRRLIGRPIETQPVGHPS